MSWVTTTLIDLVAPVRPLLVGILNVTPDSFSDGGIHPDCDAAVTHGLQMVTEGADIIDVGAESTRPGAERVSAGQQIDRIRGVIVRLRERLPEVVISIDTTLTEVAEVALASGANMLNDVAAGMESDMSAMAAAWGIPIVLMHKKGAPRDMQAAPHYDDVIDEVLHYLLERAAAAQTAGLQKSQIVIDPGIGFGKRKIDNLTLIARLSEFVKTGYPVMLGASRKSFMAPICSDVEFRELVGGTCATTALGVGAGVRIFRVHDVRVNRQAADVAAAILEAGSSPD